jgi:NTE family protein/lysophospholipid hydrolase
MSKTQPEDENRRARLRASKWFHDVDEALWDEVSSRIEHLALPRDEVLFRQGDRGDALFVVLTGRLRVSRSQADGGEAPLSELGPGDTIGEIQILAGGRRTATVQATEASELAKVPTAVLDRLLEKSPEMRREMAAGNRRRLHRSLLADLLPRLFGALDEPALQVFQDTGEWIELRRGETLFEQNSHGDHFYLLLSGRLTAVAEDDDGEPQVLDEIGRGECVGETALFTGEPRGATVRASRDSLLLGFSGPQLDEIMTRYPQVLRAILRILVKRLSAARPRLAALPRTVGRVRTLAVVAASQDVPLRDLASRLTTALSQLDSALHLCRPRLDQVFGLRLSHSEAADDPSEMRITAWLDEQELSFRFVVYEAEDGPSGWTQRCLRQADQILLLAGADGEIGTDSLRRLLGPLNHDEVANRTTLVLLHGEGESRPRETGRRLAALGLTRHHHVRQDRPADLERLARLVAGRGVGLALGGGGARGFAHIGVVRALEEAGIPIDVVGGTSSGAFVAALVAMGWDTETMVERTHRLFEKGKPFRDLTLPLVSLISGRRVDRLLSQMFSEVEIEDLWLNFFSISANLTTARQEVHQSGPVGEALRASTAVPGIVAPFLSGEDLLVDGGVLNNLPGDVLRRLWGGRVIAVDVSPTNELRIEREAARLPSSWSLLKSRLNPFAERIDFPGLFEILMRASTLGSVERAGSAKAEADLYLQPPVEEFGMFEVTAIDRIVEIGYEHARRRLEDWEV